MTIVKDLLKEWGLAWDKTLILEMFRPKEVETILNIPFGRRGEEDKLILGLNPKGIFFVKSISYATV